MWTVVSSNAAGLMVATTAVTLIGDYFLKLASLRPQAFTHWSFAGGAAMYMLSAVGFVLVMQRMSLASVACFFPSSRSY